MLRKIVKYTLRGLLVVALLLILLPALLYVPAVQDLVRRKVAARVSRSLGMELTVGRLRVVFPLRLSLEDARLVDGADTVADLRRLKLDVAPWPLLRREVDLRGFEIDTLTARYRDTASGMELRVSLRRLAIEGARAALRTRSVSADSLSLEGGDVGLDLRRRARPEKADSAAALPWAFDVGTVSVGNTAFRMRTAPLVAELSVELVRGRVERCRVRLDSQRVEAVRVLLDRGDYSFLTQRSGKVPEPTPDEERESPSPPWTILIGSIELEENRAAYGTLHHPPAEGFDPAYVRLSSLDAAVDSLRNRGADIALRLRRMAFVERSGLTVRAAEGDLRMDAAGIALTDFSLRTRNSEVGADLRAGAGLLRLEPASPLAVALTASVGTRDVNLLFPALLPAVLDDRIVRAELSASGTLADLGRIGLDLSSPGHLAFSADGRAKGLPDPSRLDAALHFRGELTGMEFLMQLLPDSALRRRVAIPGRITLGGAAEAVGGVWSGDAALGVGDGSLSLAGHFDARRERYDARLRCDTFPLNRFLPSDSLGLLDFDLHARGRGFDPYADSTRAEVRAQIARAMYRGHDFGGVGLAASLADHRLTGRITDTDDALRLSLDLRGRLTRRQQQVSVTGRVAAFDLAAMGFASERVGGTFTLDAEASATDGVSYAARVALDSIELRNGIRADRLRATAVSVAADTVRTRAGVTSGDLTLDVTVRARIDSLAARLKRSAATLRRQIRTQEVDAAALKRVLPDFELSLAAGRHNILNSYLRTRRISFGSLRGEGRNCDSLPFGVRLRAERLASGKFVLDTVRAGLRQQGHALEGYVRVENAPGNLDNLASAAVYGYVMGDTVQVNLRQRDRAGRDGFRFGLDVTWNDSLLRAGLIPERPVFGYEPWSVNRGNYLIYRFDRTLDANLDLTRGDRRFALHTIPGRELPGGIRLDIAGLDIGSVAELLPAPPPVAGVLGAGVTLRLAADSLALRGDLSVAGLAYDRKRFGDVGLGVAYEQGRSRSGSVRMTLDSTEVLAVRGDYRPGRANPLDLTAAIPGFPLERVDAFLPERLLRLTGELQGGVHAAGAPGRLRLDGGLRFARTRIRVPMIGTSFALSEDTIRIDWSRVLFDNYTIAAPNRSRLMIGGILDLSDFARMKADLSLRATDFQAVNVPRSAGTEVYGTAYLDLDATARGPLDELVVRGDIALLGGTDISYVMHDSPMEVRERPQNVVTFVSFRELDTEEPAEPVQAVRIGGMDVLLNVDINNDVKAAVDLSANGENRIDLQGGGNLTYTMNPLGDVSFSGRYVLTGGSVRYNPPVIAQKIFRITPDSYVEWVGDIADPSFNITAVETVRASVSTDGQDNRSVNFDISINIRNTLDNLSVSFDLSAPEDLTMQNQLNSLTAEQRANQAMNLLIYNTYTGPGTTARASENPLNTFIQKELNQWAQNNLKGVDLTFGIDSYGEDDPNGQRTDYSYRLSKSLFGNRVRAVIGGKISTDADPSQNLKENLIDDISLEYMLTKRDNMYIKVFRHTGYESILEGEITETGVGFVIRKKLSRLGDLFRLTRRRAEKRTETMNRNEAAQRPK